MATEKIRSEAEDSEGVELAKRLGRDSAHKPDSREPEEKHASAVLRASDAYPRRANGRGGAPAEVPTMRNGCSEVEEGLLIGVKVADGRREKNGRAEEERKQCSRARFHGDLFGK